jgi:hypothetical protein
MEWLDTKPADSMVYVSFGSLARMTREQLDELLQGVEESGRPYLCVVRKDQLAEADAEPQMDASPRNGVVVEWCDQVRVLSHAASRRWAASSPTAAGTRCWRAWRAAC